MLNHHDIMRPKFEEIKCKIKHNSVELDAVMILSQIDKDELKFVMPCRPKIGDLIEIVSSVPDSDNESKPGYMVTWTKQLRDRAETLFVIDCRLLCLF